MNMKNYQFEIKVVKIFFILHNNVNKKLNKPLFTIEQHNELYDKVHTNNIINYFIQVWKHKTGYEGMKINSFSKQACINNFIKYISNNRNLFN